MPDKKLIEVKRTTNDSTTWPSTYLTEHIAELQAYLDTVPEEYQKKVMINYEVFDMYDPGCHILELTISYVRPKTDKELADEAAFEQASIKRADLDELLLYRKLKSKFEGEQK